MDLISSFAGLKADAPGGGEGAYAMRMLKRTLKTEEGAANRMLDMLPEQPKKAPVVPKGEHLDVFA